VLSILHYCIHIGILCQHRAIIGITPCKGIMAATESMALFPSAQQDQRCSCHNYLTSHTYLTRTLNVMATKRDRASTRSMASLSACVMPLSNIEHAYHRESSIPLTQSLNFEAGLQDATTRNDAGRHERALTFYALSNYLYVSPLHSHQKERDIHH
jgi:hypothetical protein